MWLRITYFCLWQAASFADQVASGALTSELAAEVERLRAQHTDVVREKSAAENKSRRLTERLAAAEAEKGDLRRQLAEKRRDANKAIADAQAAQADAKLARAEASLARQRVEELEARLSALRNRVDKTEASTRAEVERMHAQLVDTYQELGARTAAFEAPSQEVGLRFLEWLQEELGVLPTIMMSLMSFASLVTCEGAVNAFVP
jgi:chromosome segregation ATPase